MKKKILILGSNGMAGHMIAEYLKSLNEYDVMRASRNNDNNDLFFLKFDAENYHDFENLLIKTTPKFVINAIGILNNFTESNPEIAVLINSYLPHYIARICNKYSIKLIHISTDCVFNGTKGSYLEVDNKDGIGFYAQSKSLGEVLYGDNITIRTSIIGPELKKTGIGLFDWVLRQKKSIVGYTDAYWSGVTTLELAKSIHQIIKKEYFNINLIHLTNNHKINKFNLIEIINNIFNLKLIIISDDKYKVDKSILNTNKQLELNVPSYEIMIIELKNWMILNKNIYINYNLI